MIDNVDIKEFAAGFKSKEDFKKKWVKASLKIRGIKYNKEELEKLFDERYEDSELVVYNSHRNKYTDFTMQSFIDEVYSKGLICVEHGRFFMNQEDILPPSVFIDKDLMHDRDTVKKSMSMNYEKKNFMVADRENKMQDTIKRDGNTAYGISTNKHSKFYNLDAAGSITCVGRNGIALCALICEMVMGEYMHGNLDALLDQINRILDETYRPISLEFLATKDVSLDEVFKKYSKSLPDNGSHHVLYDVLKDLDKMSLAKLYYKNDMKLFISDISNDHRYKKIFLAVNDKYNENIVKVGTKKDNGKEWRMSDAVYSIPMAYPESVKDVYEEIDILIEDILYGFYWYSGDYIKKRKVMTSTLEETLDNIERHVILLVDTDSNMILMEYYVNMLLTLYGKYMCDMSQDYKWISCSSLVTYFISKVCDYGYTKYKFSRHIIPEYQKFMVIKNEYLYSDFMITSRKKNYIALMRVKEGVIFEHPELDIKGLSIKKAGFNKKICAIISDIVEKKILASKGNTIDEILQIRDDTFKDINAVMRSDNGTEYMSVLKLGSHISNFLEGEYRVKAITLWNNMFPEYGILEPPVSFYAADVDIDPDNIRDFKREYAILAKAILDRSLSTNYEKAINRMITCYGIMGIKPSDKFLEAVEKFRPGNISIEVEDTYEIDAYIEETYNKHKESRKEVAKVWYEEVVTWVVPEKFCDSSDNDEKLIYKVNSLPKYKEFFTNTKPKLGDYCKKIAIPLSTQKLPEFIKRIVNVNKTLSTFDNLLAPVITELGLVGIRMTSGRVVLSNIVEHF